MNMDKQRKYSVYKHTCTNGKVYIGATGMDPETRFGKNGILYKPLRFYEAIKEYGWNNIKHEVLFRNLDKETAALVEKKLIIIHDSTNKERGYNSESGGCLSSHTE